MSDNSKSNYCQSNNFLNRLTRKKCIQKIIDDANIDSSSDNKLNNQSTLAKELNVIDLTALGIAAIVGAGIFSTIGNAAYNGGPAIIFLFIFTAIACGLSALCYAEFASRIPVAGSAYTYTYATLGELLAWIIGWDLLMEYSIGNIAVAISWSDYFTGLLLGYGLNIPEFLTLDYLSALRASTTIEALLREGKTLIELQKNADLANTMVAYTAWIKAPVFLGIKIICDLPALFITVIVTYLVFIGIKESKRASNIMVGLKLLIIFLVIVLGSYYINPANWSPFAPNGVAGVFKGVSAVFFAYIGFDAISTTAEECKNPSRDLPRSMILSLVICTILYIIVALVLTGVANYKTLQVGDPLAHIFGAQNLNLPWISGIVAVGAIVAMTTVLLVFQIGQPRIWMSMGRDGLLPPIFAAIHPKYKTPWFSTIVTGFVVAIPSLFMNLTEVTDLTSIGTLFAFVVVCAGVIFLPPPSEESKKKIFRVPYINGQWIVPLTLIFIAIAIFYFNPEGAKDFLNFKENFIEKIPYFIYIILAIVVAIFCFLKKYSLIPILGFLSCTYLMTELGVTNWIRFLIWLLVGFFIYFLYGIKHSKLNN
ncbi:MAG: amino acid permease [Oligoflexia bacterium]|nr:amino acid permease [Oligoflexia bacterium]